MLQPTQEARGMDLSDAADSEESSNSESWFEEERELAKSNAGTDMR